VRDSDWKRQLVKSGMLANMYVAIAVATPMITKSMFFHVNAPLVTDWHFQYRNFGPTVANN
jgi:hypothetical protein